MRIWDVATRQCIRVYDDHSGYVNTVAFHPDGTCVASAGTDNAIKVSQTTKPVPYNRSLYLPALQPLAEEEFVCSATCISAVMHVEF